MFIEIRKDDDLDHALEVFQGEIGHPVAFLVSMLLTVVMIPQSFTSRPSDNSGRLMVEAVASAWMVAS